MFSMAWLLVATPTALAWQIVRNFEPGNALCMIPVLDRNKFVGIIECADVNGDYRVVWLTSAAFGLPCQRGSTLITEATPHTRRGIVYFAVTLGELDPITFEHHNGDDRSAGVATTAMAMTMPNA